MNILVQPEDIAKTLGIKPVGQIGAPADIFQYAERYLRHLFG
jgi:hypothetical protein